MKSVNDRLNMVVIVRSPTIDMLKFSAFYAKWARNKNVDVYSFRPLSGVKHNVLPAGTTSVNFIAHLTKGKYDYAIIYGDDNANIYTMETQLRKIGIRVMDKSVYRKESIPSIKEEKQMEEEFKKERNGKQAFFEG